MVIYDVCRVSINFNGYTWRYNVYDLANKLHLGLETKSVANEIITAYKKWVLRMYFKTEKGSSI